MKNVISKFLISIILCVSAINTASIPSSHAWALEAEKIANIINDLEESWVRANFVNTFSRFVVTWANNAYLRLIWEYDDDISLNRSNTYFTSENYSGDAVTLDSTQNNSSVSFLHNNWDSQDAVDTLRIWSNFYAAWELAPKNPTSLLPIYEPCDRSYASNGAISFSNCNTFVTSDTSPLFVSYFENWNPTQWGWFTITEIRDRDTDALVNRFFLWGSQWNDFTLDPVLHQSYTFWILQEQNRDNLYIPNWGGNINLNGITTTWYDNLNAWVYSVYFQNINRFGLRSDKILAWYLEVIPADEDVNNFQLLTVNQQGESDLRNIVNWLVEVNYNTNAVVTVANPDNLDYNIIPFYSTNINVSWNTFQIDYLQQGQNVFNVEILNSAGNVLDNRTLIISVDTIAPFITSVQLDQSFIDQPTTDSAISMINYLGVTHVNDNLLINWVNGNELMPFTMRVTDNLSLSWATVSYSLDQNWVYSNAQDIIEITNGLWFNVDGSFIPNDGEVVMYFRVTDARWNESDPIALLYNINRDATAPILLTNNGNTLITSQPNIELSFELSSDTTRVLFDGLNLTTYLPLSTLFRAEVPLGLGNRNYIFNSTDILGNVSDDTVVNIIKNPTPLEWVYGTDTTIKFEWWVTTDQINLQRVTEDGTPGEIFWR